MRAGTGIQRFMTLSPSRSTPPPFKTIQTWLLLSLLSACGVGPDDSKCTGGSLESDIRYSGPLRGTAVDPDGKVKPGSYIVSTTYIKLKTDAAASSIFQDVMDGINKVLESTPGLVAFQLATSTECLSARTLSVWDDEAAMLQFVTGEAHSNAIRNSRAMSRGGGGVTHWRDTEAGVTWENSAQRVAADIRPGF